MTIPTPPTSLQGSYYSHFSHCIVLPILGFEKVNYLSKDTSAVQLGVKIQIFLKYTHTHNQPTIFLQDYFLRAVLVSQQNWEEDTEISYIPLSPTHSWPPYYQHPPPEWFIYCNWWIYIDTHIFLSTLYF